MVEFVLAPHLVIDVRHEDRTERIVVACAADPAPAPEGAAGAGWLGPQEAQHAARLKFPKRRAEYLLGRYAAKSALLAWLGASAPAELDIVPGAFQQPIVHGATRAPVGVSLAHTTGRAVAIAHDAGHPMGIDLEQHDPARVEVVRTQVAPTELPRAGVLAESQAYFLLWSVKEALAKALRCGLTCPFELLAVENARMDAHGCCTGTFANFGQYQFFAWMAGDCTFAVVGAKRAEFEPALSGLRRFTREVLVSAE